MRYLMTAFMTILIAAIAFLYTIFAMDNVPWGMYFLPLMFVADLGIVAGLTFSMAREGDL